MRKVLIISPYFPPSNTPDMQRVRLSLPYFSSYGWEVEVVVADQHYSEREKDELLLQTIPYSTNIHVVKTLSSKWTKKFGFGNIVFRSLFAYKKKVNELLKTKNFDLIYFSTTQFTICIMGPYWKKKFKIPYVIDMQDPWHSDYYRDKPKAQRPPKYWLAYWLNKYLEAKALKGVDGLVSVSAAYLDQLRTRYPALKEIPVQTVIFGFSETDHITAVNYQKQFSPLLVSGYKNLVYIGRGGLDMKAALIPFFAAIKELLIRQPEASKWLRCYFLGTSYATGSQGRTTILTLASEFGLASQVIERTERISYFHTLVTLQQADALFIPGSDDPTYTASKIYPYLLSEKPLLALFHPQSPALPVLKECGLTTAYAYDHADTQDRILVFLTKLLNDPPEKNRINKKALEKYSAKNMTAAQCQLFDKVIKQ